MLLSLFWITRVSRLSRTFIIYKPHVPTIVGTAGICGMIRRRPIVFDVLLMLLGEMVQTVVGDQQSSSRMVWFKRKEYAYY